jgi:ferredoxin-type protein NapH
LPHWLRRFAFFLLGIVLLYAPFALLTRLALWATNQPKEANAHSICLRMPIQWLSQPWMYRTMIERPTYLVAVVVLPALAFVFGPLFCGWMCPAGGLTEYLSRIVPPRFQLKLSGKFNPAPVRYGFMVGMMGASIVGGNVCCSFCNFTHAQNIISAIFGDFLGLSYWASFSVISFVLWFVVLGLFTKGGRGWCNLLCPAGALMGLFHSLGSWLKIGRSVQVDRAACRNCKTCISACSSWAIAPESETPKVNLHACNTCMDCTKVCEYEAIAYRRTTAEAPATTPAPVPAGEG